MVWFMYLNVFQVVPPMLFTDPHTGLAEPMFASTNVSIVAAGDPTPVQLRAAKRAGVRDLRDMLRSQDRRGYQLQITNPVRPHPYLAAVFNAACAKRREEGRLLALARFNRKAYYAQALRLNRRYNGTARRIRRPRA